MYNNLIKNGKEMVHITYSDVDLEQQTINREAGLDGKIERRPGGAANCARPSRSPAGLARKHEHTWMVDGLASTNACVLSQRWIDR